MPVDKAYEKELTAYEYKAAEDFASTKPIDMHEYAFGIYLGYEAGQKSLSPEVREVMEKVGINYMQKITYADKTKPEESRCLHCLCSAVYGSPIEHGEGCIVPISQNLLAKE